MLINGWETQFNDFLNILLSIQICRWLQTFVGKLPESKGNGELLIYALC